MSWGVDATPLGLWPVTDTPRFIDVAGRGRNPVGVVARRRHAPCPPFPKVAEYGNLGLYATTPFGLRRVTGHTLLP